MVNVPVRLHRGMFEAIDQRESGSHSGPLARFRQHIANSLTAMRLATRLPASQVIPSETTRPDPVRRGQSTEVSGFSVRQSHPDAGSACGRQKIVCCLGTLADVSLRVKFNQHGLDNSKLR